MPDTAGVKGMPSASRAPAEQRGKESYVLIFVCVFPAWWRTSTSLRHAAHKGNTVSNSPCGPSQLHACAAAQPEPARWVLA